MFTILFTLAVVVGGARFARGQADECIPARCNPSGPEIRFPFWLKDHHPQSCGYSSQFQLSCSPDNTTTEFHLQYPIKTSPGNNSVPLPLPVKYAVLRINYQSQQMGVSYLNGSCLPKQLPNNNLTSSQPFPFDLSRYSYNFTLFNCSSNNNGSAAAIPKQGNVVPCLTGGGYQVVSLASYFSVSEFVLPSCAKMYNIYDVPGEVVQPIQASFTYLNDAVSYIGPYLLWSQPSCGDCEAQGFRCKLKPNATDGQTECVVVPGQSSKQGASKKRIITAVATPLCVLVLLSLLFVVFSVKRRIDYQRKIERFLEDYKALRPARFTYTDIKEVTEQFKEKLGQGGYGTVYKGKLYNDVLVAVKVLNNSKGNGEEFINEVGTIGRIHHVNVVRLVGYCADGYNRALVYELLPNDSLDKVISSQKQINELGWQKLQEIAVGIAKGLDYLHQGCNQRILHFDIKPQNILLDHYFNPKVADFGLAKLCSKEQSVVFMTAARGTVGYIAPEIFSRNFGSVSYKSDVYSFGMLLLDMVGGRKRFQGAEGQNSSSEMYFPEWMYNQLEKGGEISLQIEEVGNIEVFKRLAIVGLWCIQWYPADRPSMKVVIQMLEGENMPIMPPNPFASTTANICTNTNYSDSEMSSM